MRNVQINALNIELTPAIESYVHNKMKAFDKLVDQNDDALGCNVRLSQISHQQSGNTFKAEMTLFTAGKKYGADAEKDDLYAAIDDLKDQVFRKMTAHKEKRITKEKKGGSRLKQLLRSITGRV